MLSGALKTAAKRDEISFPEPNSYDPLTPLEFPEAHCDQINLHTLFSELVWDGPSNKKAISRSRRLYQIRKGMQAFVVIQGGVEFAKNESPF